MQRSDRRGSMSFKIESLTVNPRHRQGHEQRTDAMLGERDYPGSGLCRQGIRGWEKPSIIAVATQASGRTDSQQYRLAGFDPAFQRRVVAPMRLASTRRQRGAPTGSRDPSSPILWWSLPGPAVQKFSSSRVRMLRRKTIVDACTRPWREGGGICPNIWTRLHQGGTSRLSRARSCICASVPNFQEPHHAPRRQNNSRRRFHPVSGHRGDSPTRSPDPPAVREMANAGDARGSGPISASGTGWWDRRPINHEWRRNAGFAGPVALGHVRLVDRGNLGFSAEAAAPWPEPTGEIPVAIWLPHQGAALGLKVTSWTLAASRIGIAAKPGLRRAE